MHENSRRRTLPPGRRSSLYDLNYENEFEEADEDDINFEYDLRSEHLVPRRSPGPEDLNFEYDLRNERLVPKISPVPQPAVPSRFAGNGRYIFTFFLVIVVFLLYDGIVATEQNLDVENLRKDLTTNVQDQNDAVNVVIESIQQMYKSQQKVNIVSFFGSTGVGKTFVAHVVKKYFPSSTYSMHGPLRNFETDKFVDKIKVNNYKFNLIIIDDLTVSDVDNLLKLIKKMPDDLGLFVICIFNIQETDTNLNYTINYKQIDEILDKLKKAGVSSKVARFNEFNKKQAGNWVMKQLVAKFPDESDRFKITEIVLTGQDFKHHGLKGLSSKLNVMKF